MTPIGHSYFFIFLEFIMQHGGPSPRFVVITPESPRVSPEQMQQFNQRMAAFLPQFSERAVSAVASFSEHVEMETGRKDDVVLKMICGMQALRDALIAQAAFPENTCDNQEAVRTFIKAIMISPETINPRDFACGIAAYLNAVQETVYVQSDDVTQLIYAMAKSEPVFAALLPGEKAIWPERFTKQAFISHFHTEEAPFVIPTIPVAISSGRHNNCGLHGIIHTYMAAMLELSPEALEIAQSEYPFLKQVIDKFLSKHPDLSKIQNSPKHPMLRIDALLAFNKICDSPADRELLWGDVLREVIEENRAELEMSRAQELTDLQQQSMLDQQGLSKEVAQNDPQLQVMLADLKAQSEGTVKEAFDRSFVPDQYSLLEAHVLVAFAQKLGISLNVFDKQGGRLDSNLPTDNTFFATSLVMASNPGPGNHYDFVFSNEADMQQHSEALEAGKLIGLRGFDEAIAEHENAIDELARDNAGAKLYRKQCYLGDVYAVCEVALGVREETPKIQATEELLSRTKHYATPEGREVLLSKLREDLEEGEDALKRIVRKKAFITEVISAGVNADRVCKAWIESNTTKIATYKKTIVLLKMRYQTLLKDTYAEAMWAVHAAIVGKSVKPADRSMHASSRSSSVSSSSSSVSSSSSSVSSSSSSVSSSSSSVSSSSSSVSSSSSSVSSSSSSASSSSSSASSSSRSASNASPSSAAVRTVPLPQEGSPQEAPPVMHDSASSSASSSALSSSSSSAENNAPVGAINAQNVPAARGQKRKAGDVQSPLPQSQSTTVKAPDPKRRREDSPVQLQALPAAQAPALSPPKGFLAHTKNFLSNWWYGRRDPLAQERHARIDTLLAEPHAEIAILKERCKAVFALREHAELTHADLRIQYEAYQSKVLSFFTNLRSAEDWDLPKNQATRERLMIEGIILTDAILARAEKDLRDSGQPVTTETLVNRLASQSNDHEGHCYFLYFMQSGVIEFYHALRDRNRGEGFNPMYGANRECVRPTFYEPTHPDNKMRKLYNTLIKHGLEKNYGGKEALAEAFMNRDERFAAWTKRDSKKTKKFNVYPSTRPS